MLGIPNRDPLALWGHACRASVRWLEPPSLIEQVAAPDPAATTLLRSAAEAMKLSARGYHRVLKVARTLADLDGVDAVGRIHLAGALSYRVAGDRLAAAASSRRNRAAGHDR